MNGKLENTCTPTVPGLLVAVCGRETPELSNGTMHMYILWVPFTIFSVKMAFPCKQGATLPHLYLYRLFAIEHKTDDEFIQIILLNELPSANNCSKGLKYIKFYPSMIQLITKV